MANKYEEMIRDEWEKFCKNKPLPNIMLLGATGCGKSSLINFVFGKELAFVNDVSRGTTDFETYWGRKHGISINLIDSRGYETEDGRGESFSSYYDSIVRKMDESRKADPLKKIHIVWYCISIAAERVQPYDTQIIQRLLKDSELQGRVAVLLTKSDEDDENGGTAESFKQVITTDVGRNVPVFRVSTYPGLKLDLDDLMLWSANQLDDVDMKEAFIASQMPSLKAKRESAAARIGVYSATAATVAVVPIPVSTSAVLTPLQVTMAAHIIRIYGMESFTSISSALLGDVIVSNLGRTLAGELLKLVPAAGQLIGGVINASVASLITSALGFAISEICYDSCKKIVKGEYVDWTGIFDEKTIQKYVKDYIDNH